MKNKKSIIKYILAICLIIPTMFMLSACDNTPISEKGKTYTVVNQQKDITFYWGDDKDTLIAEVGSEENAKVVFATFVISFEEEDKVKIFISGMSDGGMYYVINEYNCIEFYDTKEDAENRVNRVTEDYFGAEYKFSENKKTITIKQQVSPKSSVTIKLSVKA